MSFEQPDDFTAGIKFTAGKIPVATRTNSQGSLTTWEDLSKGGVSREDVFDMYTRNFGQKPKTVYLNESHAVNSDLYCYNYYGNTSTYNQRPANMRSVANSRTLINELDYDVTHVVELSASMEKSATVTVTEECEFSYGYSISVGSESLGLGSEFSQDFTFSNSVGSTDSTTEVVTVRDQTEVTVRPGEKVVVELDLEWKSLKEDFKIPFYIKGWTGADFGKRVNGHYYWFLTLAGYLPDGLPTMAYLKGTCVTAYDIRGTIVTKPAP